MQPKMTRKSQLVTWAIESGFAAWFVVTALSQHPQRTFDTLRKFDPIGLTIPNWRFFAPEPAVHDFHLLFRTSNHSEVVSQWREAFTVTPRRLQHAVWFPERRREKAVFDLSIDLLGLVGANSEARRKAPSHQLAENAIRRKIESSGNASNVKSFQFMIVLFTGYDESGSPDYRFVSDEIIFNATEDKEAMQ